VARRCSTTLSACFGTFLLVSAGCVVSTSYLPACEGLERPVLPNAQVRSLELVRSPPCQRALDKQQDDGGALMIGFKFNTPAF
jgi:hypothetical protein